ncbi:DUF3489 domain-containing protein, partial [Azospirillum argentinense]
MPFPGCCPNASKPGQVRSTASGPASRSWSPHHPPADDSTPAISKQAQVIILLRREQGASLDEIVAATGWQKHTVRGAISGALRKRLGLTIES